MPHMLPTGSDFTPLERAVLGAISTMHSEDRVALETQFSTANVRNRENTGAGFFTYFEVARTTGAAVGGARLRAGPMVRIEKLEHGMGFILWLKDGYAHCLEGYSYAESTTGIALEAVGFEIT